MLKMNSYALEVYAKNRKPAFVVTLKHQMLSGVYFFKTMHEAQTFINEQKVILEQFAPIQYDGENEIDECYTNVIKMVLFDENIQIGEHGKTFCN